MRYTLWQNNRCVGEIVDAFEVESGFRAGEFSPAPEFTVTGDVTQSRDPDGTSVRQSSFTTDSPAPDHSALSVTTPPALVFEVRDETGQPVDAEMLSIHSPTEADMQRAREPGAERAKCMIIFGTMNRPKTRRAAAPDRTTVSGVTAEGIFADVSAAYRAVSTYRDHGVVYSYMRQGKAPHELRFRIWFSRPDAFRFDWSSHHPYEGLRHLVTNHAIRSVDGTTTEWWEGDPEETADSLGMAIAAAAGVSAGASHSIPRLLMPDQVSGFCVLDLERIAYEGTEVFEGALCHVVRGHHPHGPSYDLWIGTADSLIRMVRSDDGDEEIHRDIVVNGAIGADVFTTAGSLLEANP